MKITFTKLRDEFERVLLSLDFSGGKAAECAGIFAANSRDGVYTHGLNRFPVFVEYVKEGLIKPDAEPTLVTAFGGMEQWDGNLGPGVLNARFCMERAINLAREHGIGCLAIKNTNHWMRGGTYGLQAAKAGYIGICFTNTIANLPPWGGTEPRLGNNPLVIAIPKQAGHIVLDMAVSQYSVGKLQQYKSENKELPLAGGYDSEGKLSTNAAAILTAQRLLPAGFWKGSGLSLVLDLLATLLSGGNSTAQITQAGKKETGVSQVFICIKADSTQNAALTEQIINYTKTSAAEGDNEILYPGEIMLRTRERNLKEGIPVDEKIWEKVLRM